jgi:hypothetical protein
MKPKGSLPCSQQPAEALQHFVTSCFLLQWQVVSPSPNPQAGGPFLVKNNFRFRLVAYVRCVALLLYLFVGVIICEHNGTEYIRAQQLHDPRILPVLFMVVCLQTQ